MGDPSVPPNSTIHTQQATRYSRSTFGAPGTSPPTPAFRSDIFGGQTSTAGTAQIFSTSPTAERHPAERKATMPSLTASNSDPHGLGNGTYPAVLIRRLPKSMSAGELNSLLTFATDLLQADFTASPYHNDLGFAAAIAYFKTPAGASDAQQKLHNKPNAKRDANMIVEDVYNQANVAYERRNTIDGLAPRTQTSSASSASSGSGPSGRSRYGSTFHSNDKVSPPIPGSGGSEFPLPGNSHHWNNLFSPQSPLANGPNGSHRVTGKSMINDDNGDDETGELLKDPVAYAKSGQRRQTHSAIPVSRLASLSLNSTHGDAYGSGNATANGYGTQRSLQSTVSPVSPANAHNSGQGPAIMNMNARMLPPANPADQNPPCNTLYVGNLPIDTSEDELKGLFSKQRGYKRLCFRTKANGPMCFVEFEDISFATKALHDLYGHLLHNSVKGGIRLSFSKNPLGVRAGQTNGGIGPNSIMSPQAMSPAYGLMSSVSGPPPGLSSPSGLVNAVGPVPYRPLQAATLDSASSNPFSASASDYVPQITRNQYSGGIPPNLGNGTYPRDTRSSFTNGQSEYYQIPNGFSYNQHNGNDYQSGGHNYNVGH